MPQSVGDMVHRDGSVLTGVDRLAGHCQGNVNSGGERRIYTTLENIVFLRVTCHDLCGQRGHQHTSVVGADDSHNYIHFIFFFLWRP